MSTSNPNLHEDNRIDNWSYLWMAMFTAVGYLFFCVVYGLLGELSLKILAAAIIVLLIVGLMYSAWKKTGSERRTVYVILFIAIVLRLCYVILTPGLGQTGTEYATFQAVQTELKLPDTYQPLYYIVSAAIFNTFSLPDFTAPFALDIVRVVTEYMGIVGAIAMYYMLCELEATDTSIYVCTSIMAFHPGLIRLGGEISPLLPMVSLVVLSLMFLARWNNYTDGMNFIFMSVSFGLAVMTDIRALLFAPVIGVLVVINLLRVLGRKNMLNTLSALLKTAGGLAIWGVLSFAYPIRNMAKGAETGIAQLFRIPGGSLNLREKFFSFSMSELVEVFVKPTDKNAWIYYLKSSLFGNLGEGDIQLEPLVLQVFIGISFAVAAISAATVFGNMIARMDSKKKVNIWALIAMLGCALVYYAMRIKESASASAMDFSVMPVILPICVVMLGSGMKVLSIKKKLSFVSNVLYIILVSVCLAFCMGCVAYGCWFI